MISSTADYLKVVMPHISPSLASAEALSKIQLWTQSLPPISSAFVECRLGKGQARVDFIVGFPCINLNLPANFLTHPAWEAFTDFSQDWTKSNSDLRRIIERVWLEFDIIAQFSGVPIPCIGFSFNSETVGDLRLMEIAIESFLRLRRCSDSLQIESKIQTCLDSLPSGARIAHIGSMLSRRANEVKLVVKGIPSEQLTDYLEQIGWKDTSKILPKLISKLSSCVESIALAFDIDYDVCRRIGLECFFEKQPFDGDLGLQSFLDDYLVKEGLCTPEKRDALLNWPGFSQEADQPDLWPSNLNRLDNLFRAKAFSVFCRTLNHIKIVYQPEHPLSAKAYLFFEHLYLERDPLDNSN